MSNQNGVDKERLLNAVEKSGYEFEFFVQDLFRKEKWAVINNRYYIDDVKNIEREIDAVAYKVKEIGNICYYTALIISCKKTKDSDWVFLTQKKTQDINFDYSPLHMISSDFRLNAIINNERDTIIEKIKRDEYLQKIHEGDNRVFAYLQVKGQSCDQDAKPGIYDSIITTIKALEHEKESHRESMRNGKFTFYCFYLISLYSNKLIEVFFESPESKTVQEVKELKYVNRHIVNKKEQFYLVHFACKDYLTDLVKVYNKVSESNARLYSKMMASFYDEIWSHEYRVRLIGSRFIDDLNGDIKWLSITEKRLKLPSDLEIKYINYKKTSDLLVMSMQIDPELEPSTLDILNEDEKAKEWIGNDLKRHFKYDGAYRIDQDWLPF